MKCYICKREACAICKFCGAALCRYHIKARRYVTGQATAGEHGWGRLPGWFYDYTTVENAIWCGKCTVKSYRKEK